MGNVYLCFKWSFIVVNVLFGIAGGLIVLLGEFSRFRYNEVDSRVSRGVMFVDITGMLTMLVAGLGVFGAYKEKKWPLIAFFLVMTAVVVVFLWAGISLVPFSSQVKDRLQVYFRSITPLDKASSEITTVANKFQYLLHCCGVYNGYQDWGGKIPLTCHCSAAYQNTPKCRTVSISYEGFWVRRAEDSELQVYSEPCAPIILKYLDKVFAVFTGAIFCVVAVAAIGMIMSMTLCCRIRKRSIELGSASSSDSRKSEVPLYIEAFPLTHVNVPQEY
ncbi:tetraspanin-8-like isoform X1 [Scleropages formosus]|uniref:Tetraspanin n=2 Tax=Scleropages formosus TaxID=113540 RepID=A0A8C9R9W4_SCLFO|nr:tetraspanin-8-like isoform X1 [Scleropages formosus]